MNGAGRRIVMMRDVRHADHEKENEDRKSRARSRAQSINHQRKSLSSHRQIEDIENLQHDYRKLHYIMAENAALVPGNRITVRLYPKSGGLREMRG
jgi:hypothetical protein